MVATKASSLLLLVAASAAIFSPATALFVPTITTGSTTEQNTLLRDHLDKKSSHQFHAPPLLWGVVSPSSRRGTALMSSTDEHHQPSLFDASEFDSHDATENTAFFEDVESEFDSFDEAQPTSQDEIIETTSSITMDYADNALTDEEVRILDDREERLFNYINNTQKVESCILVGVEDLSAQRKANKALRMQQRESGDLTTTLDDISLSWTLEESMTEMRELIKTAGLNLGGEITQRLQEVNPRTYIGTGKVKEAQQLLDEINEKLDHRNEGTCCTVVFDAELTPGQQKALENVFNKKVIENDFLGSDNDEVVKVVDRTALILDIFAQHAKTREGKLQVDLALHEYRKPRLTRMWTHLERQSGAGGVGLRGPGETQLEVDKRILRDRILVLKDKIDNVQKQRDLHRRGRKKGGLPVLALVGYTNAGKSTLLNCLTRAGILAEDILFATLDPTTRRVKLPGYKTHPEVLLTDTVGFIQKLPTQLVAAFRATLEEVKEADVLVHLVDVSNPCWRKQEVSVTNVLEEIGAGDKPIVRVFNKLDLLDSEDAEMLKYEAACSEDFSVAISSLTGEGLSDFVAVVEDSLSDLLVPIELELPYSCGNEVNLIHEVGSIEVIDYREGGTYVMGRVPRSLAMKLDKYSVGNIEGAEANGETEDEIDWAALGKGRHAKKEASY
uniref:Hflx-type G domain-containing protein n=1 Tax=Skeletonema marinoi TaxID=267567 RepID=A0A7S2KY93_9STRA|mmetsp:Transcript_17899/g.30288  ORF Transcript_17899/g.30288 Transcript_17899/m.30288 type:complete len:673 (+) Transcript_17899:95-2113(+)